MSYANLLSWISGKRPYWLYRIQRGSDVAYMTTHQGGYNTIPDFFEHRAADIFAPQDFFTQVWNYTPGIKHSRIKQTQKIKSATVSVTLPSTHVFARKFLDPLGVQETSVQILHGFANDPDQERVTRFRGRVISTKPTRTEITLSCESDFTAFRRNGLSVVMQRPCRHVLYGTGCSLNISDFETDATATAIDGTVLTVSEASAQSSGWYSGGVVTFNGARQMIVSHVGQSLVLLAPVSGLAAEIAASGSASVQIAPGCDLSRQTCNAKFNNILNHGGFHKMGSSPFDGRSIA